MEFMIEEIRIGGKNSTASLIRNLNYN